MNNNSDDNNCENNIKENLHKYVEEKHIEIENNIKLMESCSEIKKYGTIRYKCKYEIC